MRAALICCVSALALTAGTSFAGSVRLSTHQNLESYANGSAPDSVTKKSASALETQSAIAGSSYAVVSGVFDSAGSLNSYLRFFNGGTSSTNFNVTVVNSAGATVGATTGFSIPPMASRQYIMSDVLKQVAPGTAAGATYSVYIQSPGQTAGYQHVIFNGASNLFENASVCRNFLNVASVSNSIVMINVHTSIIEAFGFPMRIELHNFANTAKTYNLKVYDSWSGTLKGTVSLNAAANTSYAIPFVSGLQQAAGVNWTPSAAATENWGNVVVTDSTGATPNALVGAAIDTSAKLGASAASNMSTVCGVNPIGSSGGTGGTGAVAQSFITNASANTAFLLAANQNLTAFTITNAAALLAGTASVPTGTLQANATASITQTTKGFTFTLPDGKTVTYDLSAGATGVAGTGDYEAFTADGKGVDTKLQNGKSSALSYSTFGTWNEFADSSTDGIPLNVGTLAAGIATTSAQMPATGTVSYTGDITGFGLNATSFGEIKSGTVSISVNFAANTITGSVSNIVTQGLNETAGTMSGLTLTGTVSGTGFTISATGTAGAGSTVNIAGASGTFTGSFSGPNAAELVAASTMTGGGATVVASFGAHK